MAGTEQICGSDPSILTPLYPIIRNPKGNTLSKNADIVFIFHGKAPCSFNKCSIAIRHGDHGKLIAIIRIPSDDVTYCRNRDPYARLTPLGGGKKSARCSSGFFSGIREILFSKDKPDAGSDPSATGVLMEWLQSQREGEAAFKCRGPSSGEWEIFGKVLRFKTKSGGLLMLYKSPFPWRPMKADPIVVVPGPR